MDPRRDPHRPITKRRQLLVEGHTPHLFFEVLTAHLQVEDLEIRNFRSNELFAGFIESFCSLAAYKEHVTSLGIIRDAESLPARDTPRPPGEAAKAAFDSVCHSLRAAGQVEPPGMGAFTAGPPKIGVFILPDCQRDGMLETLCLASVLTPGTTQCIDDFFKCMDREGRPNPPNQTKARTFAFLASQDISDPLVGRAAQKGIWPWSHPAFEKLTQFLRAL